MSTKKIRIKQKSDTSTNWETNNPVLYNGEIGYDTTSKRVKIGDGLTAWNNLTHVTVGKQANIRNGEIFNDYITNTAVGTNSHAEGYQTKARWSNSHAEGYQSETRANGYLPQAEDVTNKTVTLTSVTGINVGDFVVVPIKEDVKSGSDIVYTNVTAVDTTNNTITLAKAINFAGNNITLPVPESNNGIGYLLINGGTNNGGINVTLSDVKKSAHAEGAFTRAGILSHAEGLNNFSSGFATHSEGISTNARGMGGHAEGIGAKTDHKAMAAHAEGSWTTASGNYSHAEGSSSVASGSCSHAQGLGTKATGSYAHSEGNLSTASGNSSHAEGYSTMASLTGSHAEGYSTKSLSTGSHAEGMSTEAVASASHAEGNKTVANTTNSHVEGYGTIARVRVFLPQSENVTNKTVVLDSVDEITVGSKFNIYYTIDESKQTFTDVGGTVTAINTNTKTVTLSTAPNFASHEITLPIKDASSLIGRIIINGGSIGLKHCTGTMPFLTGHAEGIWTYAGFNAHAEGVKTKATHLGAHAEGRESVASGYVSHAEGRKTIASNESSHAEGHQTSAIGQYSHSEGSSTEASSTASHSEGANTVASGGMSHAEGNKSKATAEGAHAEGILTIASGYASHAEGRETMAAATYSHASGLGTKTNVDAQTAIGKYNKLSSDSLFIVGNGTNDDNRNNAFEVTTDGTIRVPNKIVTDTIESSSGTILLNSDDEDTTYLRKNKTTYLTFASSEVQNIGFVSANRFVVANLDDSYDGCYITFIYDNKKYTEIITNTEQRTDGRYNIDFTYKYIKFANGPDKTKLSGNIKIFNQNYAWDNSIQARNITYNASSLPEVIETLNDRITALDGNPSFFKNGVAGIYGWHSSTPYIYGGPSYISSDLAYSNGSVNTSPIICRNDLSTNPHGGSDVWSRGNIQAYLSTSFSQGGNFKCKIVATRWEWNYNTFKYNLYYDNANWLPIIKTHNNETFSFSSTVTRENNFKVYTSLNSLSISMPDPALTLDFSGYNESSYGDAHLSYDAGYIYYIYLIQV